MFPSWLALHFCKNFHSNTLKVTWPSNEHLHTKTHRHTDMQTHTQTQFSKETNNLKLICSLLGNGLVCWPKHEGTDNFWLLKQLLASALVKAERFVYVYLNQEAETHSFNNWFLSCFAYIFFAKKKRKNKKLISLATIHHNPLFFKASDIEQPSDHLLVSEEDWTINMWPYLWCMGSRESPWVPILCTHLVASSLGKQGAWTWFLLAECFICLPCCSWKIRRKQGKEKQAVSPWSCLDRLHKTCGSQFEPSWLKQ